MIVIETPRLILRHLTLNDIDDLAAMYADPVVMHFWPRTMTYAETKQQLEKLINYYAQHGFGVWATIHKTDKKFIGRCGLITQIVDGQKEVEVGYMLAKEYWGQGLATEVAIASRNYAFEQVGVNRVISLIRPENIASQKVAIKNGMTYEKDTIHAGLTHRIYAVDKQEIS